jgi:DNA-binding helix-hairpin-helix protein with protein kinase domain
MIRLKCSETGEWIDLTEVISKSGEGIIYKTSKAGFFAKIYYNHTITQEKIDKLQVMVKNPPADPTRSQDHVSIAWPKCLLQDNYGKSLGFLMPAIGNGQTLINVYNPTSRTQNASDFNWYYLHTTAMNIASIVQAIHTNNYVVGDLKPENMLVTRDARVSIIDTDSFQIVDTRTGKIYRSPVASPEYTPKEMLDKHAEKVDRSEYQDRFGLAVIIWNLLFGDHPFTGKWSGNGNQPNIDQRIKHGYWMYGSSSKVHPGPLSIPLMIIHPQLQKLFRKCFNDGHNKPSARPSAADWNKALEVAIQELTQCSVASGHYYAKSYGKCYWCEKKRQLGYDIFATPLGMPQPTVLPQPKVAVPTAQPVQRPPKFRITPPPVKPAKIVDKLKALIGYGAIVLILGAIALPSFLNQANQAKQSEAKQYVGSMNRAQQAFFAEKTSFASKISDLGIGIQSETINYKYQISKLLNGSVVVTVAQPKVSGIKGYVGIVFASNTNMKLPEVTTTTLFCEQSQASNYLPNLSTIVSKNTKGDNSVNCPSGYNLIVNQSSQPQLTPKQVITKYYQLAPSNRAEAKAFLRDALKAEYRQENPNSDGKSDFWDAINSVETYSFKTEIQSPSNHQIRVWLKYFKKNGETACESERVGVMFDSSKGQWLINKVSDVEYNLDCGG